jgi:hypothetical protein
MGAAEPGAMLGLTRAGLAVLFALAVANGVFLYLFPSRAEPDYAWAIRPPASAAMMGAGYLAGMLGTGLGVFVARRFGSIRGLVPGFCGLSIVLLAATLIHADRFRWDYPPTWGWTAVYAMVPIAAVLLWRRQIRLAPDRPITPDERLGWLRAPSIALGSILAGLAVLLFIAPNALLDRWPWSVTVLVARVFAGWYLLAGLTLLYDGVAFKLPHELPIPYATVAAWSLLILPIPLIYSGSMRTDVTLYWPFIVLHAVVLAFCGLVALRGVRLTREAGERL